MTNSVIGSASNTLIALFGTINSAANVVVKTVDSATSGIDMLDRFVQKAKTEQIARHTIEAKDFMDNLIDDAAIANAKRLRDLELSLSTDQRLAQLFTESQSEYRGLFT